MTDNTESEAAVNLLREAFHLRIADRSTGMSTDEAWRKWDQRAFLFIVSQPALHDDLDEIERRLTAPLTASPSRPAGPS